MSQQSIIRPEILAEKMAAVAQYNADRVSQQLKAHPRLFELFWFIQGMSMQPGGLVKFCQSFLAQFAGRIGTATMRSLANGKAPYSYKEKRAIMGEIEHPPLDNRSKEALWLHEKFWDKAQPGHWFHGTTEAQEKAADDFFSKLDREYFLQFCRDYLEAFLPAHLVICCNEPGCALEEIWCFDDLLGALLEMLEIHAKRESASLAKTEISLKIFDAIEYAWQEKAMVSIFGDSRFGKTTSIKTWCSMWPGKARLVTVPCSNGETELFQAFARALGFQFSLGTPRREIKAAVEYIVNYSGLMFVLDEVHFAFPLHFSRNTPPSRLNWLRTEVCDRGCPLVLVSTPQEFDRCKTKFIKATSHKIEQFLGRTMLNVPLPNELDESDLLAVARHHFPDLENDFLQLIVGTAMLCESYLMAVEAIAKRVRYIARRNGHKSATPADLNLAISEIVPKPNSAPAAQAKELPSGPPRPIAVKRPRAVRPTATPSTAALEAPARSVTPAPQLEPV